MHVGTLDGVDHCGDGLREGKPSAVETEHSVSNLVGSGFWAFGFRGFRGLGKKVLDVWGSGLWWFGFMGLGLGLWVAF